jgi:hypothetical protein
MDAFDMIILQDDSMAHADLAFGMTCTIFLMQPWCLNLNQPKCYTFLPNFLPSLDRKKKSVEKLPEQKNCVHLSWWLVRYISAQSFFQK